MNHVAINRAEEACCTKEDLAAFRDTTDCPSGNGCCPDGTVTCVMGSGDSFLQLGPSGARMLMICNGEEIPARLAWLNTCPDEPGNTESCECHTSQGCRDDITPPNHIQWYHVYCNYAYDDPTQCGVCVEPCECYPENEYNYRMCKGGFCIPEHDDDGSGSSNSAGLTSNAFRCGHCEGGNVGSTTTEVGTTNASVNILPSEAVNTPWMVSVVIVFVFGMWTWI